MKFELDVKFESETVFFLSDMPVLGFFNYRKFLFQRLKVLMAWIFQVVKSFALQMLKVWETLFELFSKRNVYSEFCEGAKLFKLFVSCEKNLKCLSSSKFEPRSFAKCLQNLLIEEKSVERLWRFSKGWT